MVSSYPAILCRHERIPTAAWPSDQRAPPASRRRRVGGIDCALSCSTPTCRGRGLCHGQDTDARPAFTFVEAADHLDLRAAGTTWLSTVTAPFDPERAEETYKVFTHIYDFEGAAPITKGAGGKYTHHRGMFIGWKDTLVQGEDFDTWHMPNCHQEHVTWRGADVSPAGAVQAESIAWKDGQGVPFIKEVRRITAHAGTAGTRIFDFESELTSLRGTIQLRGDLQHAGMQVRMANEVVDHEDTTRYILPEGAQSLENDKVVGAWWVCCSPVVRGKRYWIMHMTPSDHLTGQPIYSIRAYARFGAFFEPDLNEGKPVKVRFRVLLSEQELDQEACQALYDAFEANDGQG